MRISFLPLLACIFVSLQSKVHADQVEVTAESTVTIKNDSEPWRYLLHLPTSYDPANSTKKWPLLFYLHGRSLRGNDLAKLKRYGPPQFLDKKPDFPFVVVSPQLPDGGWPPQALLKLLDEVLGKYAVDPDRVCLVGTSLGAGGAWEFAGHAPEKFAALVPLCGYRGTYLAKRLTKLPIWAFHGDADELVSIEPHRELVEAINENGGNAKLTVIPGGTHGSIIFPIYKSEELYDWLLKQRRASE